MKLFGKRRICFGKKIIFEQGDLKKLRDAWEGSNIYTIKIKSINEYLDIELVPKSDYDQIVSLYNALIDDIEEGDLTSLFSCFINNIDRRFLE